MVKLKVSSFLFITGHMSDLKRLSKFLSWSPNEHTPSQRLKINWLLAELYEITFIWYMIQISPTYLKFVIIHHILQSCEILSFRSGAFLFKLTHILYNYNTYSYLTLLISKVFLVLPFVFVRNKTDEWEDPKTFHLLYY